MIADCGMRLPAGRQGLRNITKKSRKLCTFTAEAQGTQREADFLVGRYRQENTLYPRWTDSSLKVRGL
jgi:hypothetical protein